ncbi:MAG: hypothetical protein HXX08_25165 [Chloroflexi bacterium]|uniref:Uncharacterized protein n=1 Tax=Candidatus Chlorohelix allophototropha TaxID=3003348 RepID=A0A8T7MAU6_9CHLR|nr:hypothetical protein [Chloroflexota bacterium]WJW70309.1 hypothetical protein OZ401_005040 [Chloroflexota bacterium L227-S17]
MSEQPSNEVSQLAVHAPPEMESKPLLPRQTEKLVTQPQSQQEWGQ